VEGSKYLGWLYRQEDPAALVADNEVVRNLGAQRMTIQEAFRYRLERSEANHGVSWLTDKGGIDRFLSFRNVDEQARAMAHTIAKNANPGDCVLLIYPPSLDFLPAFLGCLYAGVVAVPLAPLNIASLTETDLAKFNHVISDCGATVALTTSSYKRMFSLAAAKVSLTRSSVKLLKLSWIGLDLLSDKKAAAASAKFPESKIAGHGADTALAYLQYSSGSTGNPKGVMVTHRTALQELFLLVTRFRWHSKRVHMWVPHWHDLGLVAAILGSIVSYEETYLMSPLQFLSNPMISLKIISEKRVTLTCMNNFALEHIVKKYASLERQGRAPSLDLSCMRHFMIGGDFAYPGSVIRAMELFTSLGMRMDVFGSTWGQAEATLAVSVETTSTRGEGGTTFIHLDRDAYAEGRVLVRYTTRYGWNLDAAQFEQDLNPSEVVLVSAGPPFRGAVVRVVNPETCEECPSDRIGELWAASPAVCPGYWNNPEKTEEVFRARIVNPRSEDSARNWLRSGDLGFLYEGRVYITSRLKDIIIVNGENYFAADIEPIIERCHPIIRKGNCVIFSVGEGETGSGRLGQKLADAARSREDRQVLVVVAEVRSKDERMAFVKADGNFASGSRGENELFLVLARAVRQSVAQNVGLSVSAVVLVKGRTIPKTTSGKKRRSETKRLLVTEGIRPIFSSISGEFEAPKRATRAVAEGDVPALETGAPRDATNGEPEVAAASAEGEGIEGVSIDVVEGDEEDDENDDGGGEDFAFSPLTVEEVTAKVASLLGGGSADYDPAKPLSALGMDSVMAMTMSSWCADHGVDLSIADFLGGLTIQDVVARAGPSEQQTLPPRRRERRDARGTEFALTPPQTNMWLYESIRPGTAHHNIAMPLEVTGPGVANPAVYRRAVGVLYDRHEALRLRVCTVTAGGLQFLPREEDATNLLEVHPVSDEAALPTLLRRLAGKPFSVTAPREEAAAHRLVRVHYCPVADDRIVLLFVFHHLILDGRSARTLVQEFLALLSSEVAPGNAEASQLPPPTAQYGDFAKWCEEFRTTPQYQAQVEYWGQHVKDLEGVKYVMPDLAAAEEEEHVAAARTERFSARVVEKCRALARTHETTVFTVLASLWMITLHRYSEADDVCVGCTYMNRPRPDFASLVGCCVNVVPFRAQLPGETTVASAVAEVKRLALGMFANGQVSLDEILKLCAQGRAPPTLQSLFVHQEDMTDGAGAAVGEWTVRPQESPLPALPFELVLQTQLVAGPTDGTELLVRCEYDSSLFSTRRIGHLLDSFVLALECAADRSPETPIGELEVVRPELFRELTRPEAREDPPLTVTNQLAEYCQTFARRVALKDKNRALTYEEMGQEADRVAAHLMIDMGVTPGQCVALYLTKSTELIVAMIAVLRAGCHFVILDVKAGQEARDHILQDAGVVLVLLSVFGGTPFPPGGFGALRIATIGPHLPPRPFDATAPSPTDLCYIVYTSGSTGKPKGVMVEHQGLANFLVYLPTTQQAWMRKGGYKRRDYMQFLAPNFDGFISEVFLALSAGGTLHIPGRHPLLGNELCDFLRVREVNLVFLPPSVLATIPPNADLPRLDTIVSMGETLTYELAARWHVDRKRRVLNCYGPSECSVHVTTHEFDPGAPQARSVPVGRTIPNKVPVLLNGHGQLVPEGAPGTLFVGGVGQSPGYRNLPDETARRFVPNPFRGTAVGGGDRLYNTGDLLYLAPGGDGAMVFLGREDGQTKIRGVRVELSAVEDELRRLQGVGNAVVLKGADGASTVAYVTEENGPGEGTSLTYGELRRGLLGRVTAAAVPSKVYVCDGLPLLPSGKADRKVLARDGPPEGATLLRSQSGGSRRVPPASLYESDIQEIFRSSLKAEYVGMTDDFFELGGHSLLAIQLVKRVQEQMCPDTKLEVKLLFDNPTPRALAQAVQHQAQATTPYERTHVLTLRGTGSRTPLFLVHGGIRVAYLFRHLANALDKEQPVYGLQGLDGLEDRPTEPEPANMEELALRYATAIQEVQPFGPYRLAGYCIGGLIAIETAKVLQLRGETVDFLGLMDTTAPTITNMSGLLSIDHAMKMKLLSDYFELSQGIGLDITREEIAAFPEADQKALVLHRIRAKGLLNTSTAIVFVNNFLAHLDTAGDLVGSWEGDTRSLSCRELVLFRACEQTKEYNYSEMPDLGWGEITSDPVRVDEVRGGHLSMMFPPHVNSLAARLTALLGDSHMRTSRARSAGIRNSVIIPQNPTQAQAGGVLAPGARLIGDNDKAITAFNAGSAGECPIASADGARRLLSPAVGKVVRLLREGPATDDGAFGLACRLAGLAYSTGNNQPWRFVASKTGGAVDVVLCKSDVAHTEPAAYFSLVSCGCAVETLVSVLVALGYAPKVEFMDDEALNHAWSSDGSVHIPLCTVRQGPRNTAPRDSEASLGRILTVLMRHTNRRKYHRVQEEEFVFSPQVSPRQKRSGPSSPPLASGENKGLSQESVSPGVALHSPRRARSPGPSPAVVIPDAVRGASPAAGRASSPSSSRNPSSRSASPRLMFRKNSKSSQSTSSLATAALKRKVSGPSSPQQPRSSRDRGGTDAADQSPRRVRVRRRSSVTAFASAAIGTMRRSDVKPSSGDGQSQDSSPRGGDSPSSPPDSGVRGAQLSPRARRVRTIDKESAFSQSEASMSTAVLKRSVELSQTGGGSSKRSRSGTHQVAKISTENEPVRRGTQTGLACSTGPVQHAPFGRDGSEGLSSSVGIAVDATPAANNPLSFSTPGRPGLWKKVSMSSASPGSPVPGRTVRLASSPTMDHPQRRGLLAGGNRMGSPSLAAQSPGPNTSSSAVLATGGEKKSRQQGKKGKKGKKGKAKRQIDLSPDDSDPGQDRDRSVIYEAAQQGWARMVPRENVRHDYLTLFAMDEAVKRAAREVLCDAAEKVFAIREVRQGVVAALRFVTAKAAPPRDGLSLAHCDISVHTGNILKQAAQMGDKKFRLLKLTSLFRNTQDKAMQNCASILCITRPRRNSDVPFEFASHARSSVNVGRTLTTAWLECTANRLQVQPVDDLTFPLAVLRADPHSALGSRMQPMGFKDLERQLLEVLGRSNDEILFMARIGSAPRPTGNNGRLPIDMLFLGGKSLPCGDDGPWSDLRQALLKHAYDDCPACDALLQTQCQ